MASTSDWAQPRSYSQSQAQSCIVAPPPLPPNPMPCPLTLLSVYRAEVPGRDTPRSVGINRYATSQPPNRSLTYPYRHHHGLMLRATQQKRPKRCNNHDRLLIPPNTTQLWVLLTLTNPDFWSHLAPNSSSAGPSPPLLESERSASLAPWLVHGSPQRPLQSVIW